VADDPAGVLGPAVDERFGRFPFLLKVLAASEPLSIQAHPDRRQAEAGFAREEASGADRDDPKRSYRDDNHKPELLCALTPFEAKCGFRALDQTVELVSMLAEVTRGRLDELVERVDGARMAVEPGAGLSDLVGWLLHLPVEETRALVASTVSGARALTETGAGCVAAGSFGPELAWTVRLDELHRGDIGVVVALLLNHVALSPGQALFLGAGNLHAYLAGAGVELMANSDNVIRGGLTVKHVDVDELLRVLDTDPGPAPIQSPLDGCHAFEAPVADFSLTRLGSGQSRCFEPQGPEILLVTSGQAALVPTGGSSTSLGRGEASLVRWSDGTYRVETGPGTVAWRAAVGQLGLDERRR
jgi:mannose-6-phosphate isomerase